MPLFRGLLFCVPTCFLEVICPRHSPDMSTIISTINILIDSKIANKSIKNSKITKISSSNFSITKKKKKKQFFFQCFNMSTNVVAKSIYNQHQCYHSIRFQHSSSFLYTPLRFSFDHPHLLLPPTFIVKTTIRQPTVFSPSFCEAILNKSQP